MCFSWNHAKQIYDKLEFTFLRSRVVSLLFALLTFALNFKLQNLKVTPAKAALDLHILGWFLAL